MPRKKVKNELQRDNVQQESIVKSTRVTVLNITNSTDKQYWQINWKDWIGRAIKWGRNDQNILVAIFIKKKIKNLSISKMKLIKVTILSIILTSIFLCIVFFQLDRIDTLHFHQRFWTVNSHSHIQSDPVILLSQLQSCFNSDDHYSPLSADLELDLQSKIPNIIHQSWKSEELPLVHFLIKENGIFIYIEIWKMAAKLASSSSSLAV